MCIRDSINAIECTDAEERYLTANWYYDSNLHLFRIEIPSTEPGKPAKIKMCIRDSYRVVVAALVVHGKARVSSPYIVCVCSLPIRLSLIHI